MKKKALLIFMALLLLLQVYTLFLAPSFGIHGEGTPYGVLVENGLYQFEHSGDLMVYGIENNGQALNTVPIMFAKMISGLFSENIFFVSILAVIYVILFDVGVYLAFSKLKSSTKYLIPLLMVVVFLIFGDTGYLAYFNSITYEGAALAYLSLLVGSSLYLVCSEKPAVWNLVLTAIAAFLLAGTAKQMFWIGIPCVLLLVRFAFARKETWWRIVAALMAFFVLLGNSIMFLNMDVQNSAVSRYQSVFYGVLYDVPEVEKSQAIEWLNLPVESETSLESMGEEEKISVAENVSYGRVTGYYLTHPKAFYRMAKQTVANSFFVRHDYLDYTKWEDQTKPMLSIWNAVKKMLPIQNIFMVLILWIAMVVACVRYRKENPLHYDLGLWLLLSSLISFFLPVIFFGFAQISRTVFPFALLMDVIIVFLIGWGVETLVVRQKKVKEKYGITQ